MKISTIIPAYNEEKVILNCLKSLDDQSAKNFEVIVVDDGSSDSTLSLLGAFKTQKYEYKFLNTDHKGPALARNLGAKNSKGQILVFVDSDMTFSKDFIKNLVAPIISHKSKGTFSKDEFVANWHNVWARCWNYNQNLSGNKRHTDDYPDTQKVFRAILKSEFDGVGGFNKGGYTDDYTLSEKLGYKAEEASDAIFYHNNPENLVEVFHQAKWTAKREYRFGIFGIIVNLVRLTMFYLPTAVWKTAKFKSPAFAIFKLVYNLGSIVGILEYKIKGLGIK